MQSSIPKNKFEKLVHLVGFIIRAYLYTLYKSVPFVTLFDGLLRYRMTNAPIPVYRDPVFETIKANVYREVRYGDPNGDVKTG
jgi:hypothetical protein